MARSHRGLGGSGDAGPAGGGSHLGATLEYQDFGEQVQEATGIRTRSLLMNWIGEVLGAVATAQPAGEPTLTSLVVRADGTIGPGYAEPIIERDGTAPEDLDWHAAEERLACYKFFGAELPAGGGSPMLTAKVAGRRDKAKKAEPRRTCPDCNLMIPTSGVCDSCG